MAIGSLLQGSNGFNSGIFRISGYFEAFHNMREKYRDEDGKGRQPACALILVSGACLQMRLPKTAGHVV